MYVVPPASVNVRGSIDPMWSNWQMNGCWRGTKGPAGEDATVSPMHSIAGLVPRATAVKDKT